MKINKKIIILILIALSLVLIYFLAIKPAQPKKSLITETKSIFKTDIKNLHWLNNQELAFTYFESDSKRRALGKTNGIKEDLLLKDPKLKFSEVFWSSKNDLLIFEYGIPYTTYIYDNSGKLSQLPVSGYGFSWSPDGDSFFYQPEADNTTVEPKIYEIATKKEESLGDKLPPFNVSLWTPSQNQIALYNYDLEINAGALALFNLETRNINNFTQKKLYPPKWDPTGQKIAYLTADGIYVYDGQNEKQVYKTQSQPQFVSFLWLNDQQLLIFDLELKKQIIKVGLGDGATTPVNILPELQTQQQIQLELSPDQETLAVAGEKDGLWLVKTKDFR